MKEGRGKIKYQNMWKQHQYEGQYHTLPNTTH